MAIPIYLAMTGAEFHGSRSLPSHIAWLSCLFSPYSTGITNLPRQLPMGSLLVLSDRIPICGHDSKLIKEQLRDTLQRLHCRGLLLDLQQADSDENLALAKELLTLPFPVAVSESYAAEFDCPVFLSPQPLDTPLAEQLTPWQGREIWLDVAPQNLILSVTVQGCCREILPGNAAQLFPFYDCVLHCHYSITCADDSAKFHLYRGKDDLADLLADAESMGVTMAVGLYQELG